jgi:hypothetical protein
MHQSSHICRLRKPLQAADEAPMKPAERQTGDESCATLTANSYVARSWEATRLRLLITFKF